MTVRSCVVCRRADEKRNLLRFVARLPGEIKAGTLFEVALLNGAGLRLFLDLAGNAEGRGASCHATTQCLFDKGLLGKLQGTLLKTKRSGRGERGEQHGGLAQDVLKAAIESLLQGAVEKQNYKLLLPQFKELQKCLVNGEKREKRIRL